MPLGKKLLRSLRRALIDQRSRAGHQLLLRRAAASNRGGRDHHVHAHCAANLARFKCPHLIRFVDALPRNATGKIHKPTLRKNFSTASATDLAEAKASSLASLSPIPKKPRNP